MWRQANLRARSILPAPGRAPAPAHARYSTTGISAAARAYVRVKNALSFSGYTLLVAGGLAFTGYAGWCIVEELVLPSSDVRIFQNAFKLIEKDAKVQEVLGTRLKAHGEATHNRAARTRPIASRRSADRNGVETVRMQFYVEGKDKTGLAKLEQINQKYQYLLVELPGYGNHYIIGGVRPKTRNALGWLLGRA